MRTKRTVKVKYKAFFIIFKGLSVAKTCLRLESVPLSLTILPNKDFIILVFQIKSKKVARYWMYIWQSKFHQGETTGIHHKEQYVKLVTLLGQSSLSKKPVHWFALQSGFYVIETSVMKGLIHQNNAVTSFSCLKPFQANVFFINPVETENFLIF